MPPVTQGAAAKLRGKQPTTKSLASQLSAYASDSQDGDYAESDDESKGDSASASHSQTSDNRDSDSDSKTDSNDQPLITGGTKRDIKGKAKVQFVIPEDPESEDDVSTKPESSKCPAQSRLQSTPAKKFRVHSFSSDNSSDDTSSSSSVVEIQKPASEVAVEVVIPVKKSVTRNSNASVCDGPSGSTPAAPTGKINMFVFFFTD